MYNSCYYCSIFQGEQKKPIKGSIFSRAIERSEQTETGSHCDRKKLKRRMENAGFNIGLTEHLNQSMTKKVLVTFPVYNIFFTRTSVIINLILVLQMIKIIIFSIQSHWTQSNHYWLRLISVSQKLNAYKTHSVLQSSISVLADTKGGYGNHHPRLLDIHLVPHVCWRYMFLCEVEAMGHSVFTQLDI